MWGSYPRAEKRNSRGRGTGTWGRGRSVRAKPWSAGAQGQGEHSKAGDGSHPRRDMRDRGQRGGGAARTAWEAGRGSENTGDGLASQPCRYRVPGQPLLNRHQVGGVSRSRDGLLARNKWADQPGGGR